MAARNQATSIVSIYVLPQADHTPIFTRLVAVPVFASGRLWGNLIALLPL